MRGVFVTGTDTGVGKTVVAAAICAALAARGVRVAAYKPAVTGIDDDAPAGWSHDHDLLAAAASAGQSPAEVAPARFGPPLSPHYAAALAGTPLDRSAVLAGARAAAAAGDVLVCEGVGGLLVPLADGYLIRDLAVELALPLVVVARPGLGTINHTLLTLAAARAAGLDPVGVVLNPWPAQPTGMERSNRATIESLGCVPTAALAETTPELLADAGAELPLERWIGALA